MAWMEVSNQMFVSKLATALNYAELVYGTYLQNGKKFVYASVLFKANEEIRNVIRHFLVHLSAENQSFARELLLHIEVWQTIWLAEVETQSPAWNDAFEFATELPFPKDAVEQLLNIV